MKPGFMRVARYLLFTLAVFFFATVPRALYAQNAPPNENQPKAKKSRGGKASPAPEHITDSKLEGFAWLEGTWQGTWGPRTAQQMWMPAKGGAMTGIFQLIEGDKTLVIELFSLVEKSDGLELHIRHFTPALQPWENTDSPALRLASIDAKSAIFENSAGGDPKRIVFTRVSPGLFISRSEIVGAGGEEQATEITYAKLAPKLPPRR